MTLLCSEPALGQDRPSLTRRPSPLNVAAPSPFGDLAGRDLNALPGAGYYPVPMSTAVETPAIFLRRTLESGRIHSGYVISGIGEAALNAAIQFARAVVCGGDPQGERPCEACRACQLSGSPSEAVKIDGEDKKGPAFTHLGNHPDLYLVERGVEDTVIRVEQVRALQKSMRVAAREGGRRVAIFADAEEMNANAQNALLRLLEEPPPGTTLLLATSSVHSLLATIRSRCIRVPLPAQEVRDLRCRLSTMSHSARTRCAKSSPASTRSTATGSPNCWIGPRSTGAGPR